MNKKTTSIQVNKDLKEMADDLFDALGLDTETAVNSFLAASIREMGIPFHIGFKEDMIDTCDCDCDDDDCDCKKIAN